MILAIIQARMGSSRLPGKVLKKINKKTILELVVERIKNSKFIDEIVVATSIEKNNLPLIELCSSKSIRVFAGSENNVLDRFYQLAKLIEPTHIVRITADCPLHDSEVIDKVIETHLQSKSDYTSNVNPPTFPDGLDIEIFTYKALENAWLNAREASDLEHVTPYIRNNQEIKNTNFENPIDYSDLRWTLDEEKDFVLIEKIYQSFAPRIDFKMNEIIDLVNKDENLKRINSQYTRNEGAKQ